MMTEPRIMKNQTEIAEELAKVRVLLAERKANDIEHMELYYAQQALSWVSGEGCSVTQMEAVVEEIAGK